MRSFGSRSIRIRASRVTSACSGARTAVVEFAIGECRPLRLAPIRQNPSDAHLGIDRRETVITGDEDRAAECGSVMSQRRHRAIECCERRAPNQQSRRRSRERGTPNRERGMPCREHQARNAESRSPNRERRTPNREPGRPNLKPRTLNPECRTQSPDHRTGSSAACRTQRRASWRRSCRRWQRTCRRPPRRK